MAGFATALSARGAKTIYIAEIDISEDRKKLGWSAPDLGSVEIRYLSSAADALLVVMNASIDSVHICQGIRSNGFISTAQELINKRKLRHWVFMEMVDDSGPMGIIKRLEYRRILHLQCKSIEGILAVGQNMPKWLASRGFPSEKIFPFTYFISNKKLFSNKGYMRPSGRFRFLFVGQFIKRKNLGFLIEVLSSIDKSVIDFELLVVGSGLNELELHTQSINKLGSNIQWIGKVPIGEVRAIMSECDCLILPSLFDGWGVVVSESLMVGTPAIVSDQCGSYGAVLASGVGGVFKASSSDQLSKAIVAALDAGKIQPSRRAEISNWANCLDGISGANYFLEILDYSSKEGVKPIAPWLRSIFNAGIEV